MSRTFKDVPYRVKEEKARVENKRACALCEVRANRNNGYSVVEQVFYAHDVKAIEEFIALFEDKGFELESEVEAYGYLGERKPSYYSFDHAAKTIAPNLFQLERKVFIDRSEAFHNPKREAYEKFLAEMEELGGFGGGSSYEATKRYTFHEMEPQYNVATKANVFKTVTLKKLREGHTYDCYHQSLFKDDYRFGYRCTGVCCDPIDTKKTLKKKNTLKKAAKAFNSHNEKDFEKWDETM